MYRKEVVERGLERNRGKSDKGGRERERAAGQDELVLGGGGQAFVAM